MAEAIPAQLNTRQAAEFFGVTQDTVRRWIDEARITASRTPGGRIRISRDEVLRWNRKRGTPELIE